MNIVKKWINKVSESNPSSVPAFFSGQIININGVIYAWDSSANGGLGAYVLGRRHQYNPVIPLDSDNAVMEREAVSGAITFSPSSIKMSGASTTLELVADGTNFPLFSGMAQLGGGGYDNTAGARNIVRFFFDGATVWYSITQPAFPISAPAYSSSVVYAGASIQLNFSSVLDPNFIPKSADFAITASGGAVTVVNGGVSVFASRVRLSLSRTILDSETISVSYTPGTVKLQGYSTALVSAFNGTPTFQPLLEILRGTGLVQLSESGSAESGWSYTSTTATGFGAYCGISKNLQNGVGGLVGLKIGDVANPNRAYIVGLKTTSTPSGFSGYAYGVYNHSGGVYRIITAGAAGAAANTVSVAIGDITRLRRSGTTLYAEVSKDDGYTWLLIHTWTGISTGILYGMLNLSELGTVCSSIYGSGLA